MAFSRAEEQVPSGHPFSLAKNDAVELALFNGLAMAFDALGEHDKALDLFSMAVELAEENLNYPDLGALYHNHSQALFISGDIESALELAELAVDAETRLGTPNGLAHVLAHYA